MSRTEYVLRWLGSRLGIVTQYDLKQLEIKMAQFKQDVLDDIAAEKAEVQAALAAQDDKIKALELKIANGEVVTPEDAAEIRGAVKGIFTPST